MAWELMWLAWSNFFFFFLLSASTVRMAEGSHALYQELQSVPASVVDPNSRTAYHFQPQKHWINDPNGPMYYRGIYHLFYQYNPKGSVWGNIVWAHSISRDLVNWESLDHPAIYPSKPFDVNGAWSGSATILPDGRPAILYTGVDARNRQVQNIAFPSDPSDPYLRHWDKPDYNPVMSPDDGVGPAVNASAYRDPTTGWLGRDGWWRVVVGSKWGETGQVLLYKSKDFVRWTRVSRPLHSTPGTGMLECPDFFPVATRGPPARGLDTSVPPGKGVKHVLKASLDETRFEYYTLGRYVVDRRRRTETYVPDGTSPDNRAGLRYDYGNFYASKSFYDPKNRRRILWGWANESDSTTDDVAKGWAGIQAIPRSVWLDRSGKQLVQWPVAELEKLRGSKVELRRRKISPGGRLEVTGITNSAQADVEAVFELSGLEMAESLGAKSRWDVDPEALCAAKGGADARGGSVGPFGLYVLASRGMEEMTAVFFRVFKTGEGKHAVLMCHDPTRSSLSPGMYKPTFAGFVDIDIGRTKRISLRSLIDHTVVESFGGGGRTCITSRVYPSLAVGKEARIFVFNNGGEHVTVSHLTAWEMKKPDCMN